MNDRKSNAAPIAIAVLLLLLPCLYVGSYFALVQRDGSLLAMVHRSDEGMFRRGNPWQYGEHYGAGGYSARAFYKPINWIDRRLRLSHWDMNVS
jgi:hypothetical protein